MHKEKDFMLFGLSPNQSSLRGIWLFFGIYFGATIFAAILTPPVFLAFHYFGEYMPEWLMRKRVDIFFDRIRYIPILIGIPWLIKATGLFSLSNIGMRFDKKNLAILSKYFFGGLGIAVFIYALQIAFANSAFTPMKFVGAAEFISFFFQTFILSWLFGALLVSILEEIIFRALSFRCFYTAVGVIWAVVLTSAFFAYKHFHVPSSIWKNIPDEGLVAHWYTGFIVAWYDLVGIFITWDTVMFAALFVFGAVLSMIYVRTKVLWGPIGFHAGIVFAMFVYKNNFTLNFTPEQEMFFGGKNPSSGVLSLIILSVILLLLCISHVKNRRKSPNADVAP